MFPLYPRPGPAQGRAARSLYPDIQPCNLDDVNPVINLGSNGNTGEEIPVLDEEGNQVYQGKRPVYNPEYDHTQPYISRMDRPEWAAVGMLGVLSVYDDGTCEVNGYCTVGDNGIATKAIRYDRTANCYKVIQRLKNNIIRVIFR